MQIEQAIDSEKGILTQVLHVWGTLLLSADDFNFKMHKDEACIGIVLSRIHSPCPQSATCGISSRV